MKLSDTDIRQAIDLKQIVIDPPLDSGRVGAVSVDLELGTDFRVFRASCTEAIDLAPPGERKGPDVEDIMEEVHVPEGGSFILNPGSFALGITSHCVTISPHLSGRLDGRSSLARLGLMVHATAHTIDPGWHGRITLEFFNCGPLPLVLRPGMRICALSFETLQSPTTRPYASSPTSKYRDQQAPLPSRIVSDKDHAQ